MKHYLESILSFPSSSLKARSCLILGLTGAGKTTVVNQLNERAGRKAAYDADAVICLGDWFDERGEPLESYNPDSDRTSQYLWDIGVLSAFMWQAGAYPFDAPFYLAGIAPNAMEFTGLFDRTICLLEDPEILHERIHSRDNHLFPVQCAPGHLDQLRGHDLRFRQEISAIGAITVGPGLSISQVTDAIEQTMKWSVSR
jgi:hypothetical protein